MGSRSSRPRGCSLTWTVAAADVYLRNKKAAHDQDTCKVQSCATALQSCAAMVLAAAPQAGPRRATRLSDAQVVRDRKHIRNPLGTQRGKIAICAVVHNALQGHVAAIHDNVN